MSASGTAGRKSVLFVCLGNICRSPIAEAVFLESIKNRSDRAEWTVESCATGDWHTGGGPDPRCLRTLKHYGITDYKHVARQISKSDFQKFHYIFGMDANNMSVLNSMTPSGFYGKVSLLGKYDPDNKSGIIQDPYYDRNEDGFRKVYELSKRACESFLKAEFDA